MVFVDRVYREEKWKSQLIVSQTSSYTYPPSASSLKHWYLNTNSAQEYLLKQYSYSQKLQASVVPVSLYSHFCFFCLQQYKNHCFVS